MKKRIAPFLLAALAVTACGKVVNRYDGTHNSAASATLPPAKCSKETVDRYNEVFFSCDGFMGMAADPARCRAQAQALIDANPDLRCRTRVLLKRADEPDEITITRADIEKILENVR